MESRTKNTLYITLILFFIFIAGTLFSGNEYVSFLKSEIRGGKKKIDSIERTKYVLFEEIERDSARLSEMNYMIDSLINENNELKSKITDYENENNAIKNAYIISSIDKRVELFTRLVSEKD